MLSQTIQMYFKPIPHHKPNQSLTVNRFSYRSIVDLACFLRFHSSWRQNKSVRSIFGKTQLLSTFSNTVLTKSNSISIKKTQLSEILHLCGYCASLGVLTYAHANNYATVSSNNICVRKRFTVFS